jgi:YfiH family protein
VWAPDANGVFYSPLLSRLDWIHHGFGSAASTSWPGRYDSVVQIHSDIVIVADGEKGMRPEKGDALITRASGQLIGVRTADCVPLLLAATDVKAVAAVHAGWRGTIASIAVRTVERLQSEYGADPKNVLAAIGPCIGRCCFEVQQDVAQHFESWFPKDGRLTHIELASVNRHQLLQAGLDDQNLDVSDLCTVCSGHMFHSYRRDKNEAGRMVAAINVK